MPHSQPTTASSSVTPQRRRFVVSDIHGHPEKLLAALQQKNLADGLGAWSGGNAQLWCLGDYFDRGPDGVGVVDLLIRLSVEAEAAGGEVTALLGNHEVLTLGKKRFGSTPINTSLGERSFDNSWLRNQGQESDQARLSAQQLEWLTDRPAMAQVDDQLLLHSDIVHYRQWGASAEEVNENVRRILRTADPVELWQLWAALTKRNDFQGPDGPASAQGLLRHFGGRHIFHGHSIIGEDEGQPASANTEPKTYADGLVTAIDGGLHAGGPCLLVEF